MPRKYPLWTGGVYHLMSKSIEGYTIFPQTTDYERMLHLLRYFTLNQPPNKFSFFLSRNPAVQQEGFEATVNKLAQEQGTLVQIIAYCLMPTHFHVIVKQQTDNGVSDFMRRSLNGYARYFNTKYKRHGTLWMSRFKNVPVENDEQLLHLTRYIHLNPVTAGLATRPDQWLFSSYHEYLAPSEHQLTQFAGLLQLEVNEYRAFVENHAAYQRELALIKAVALEDMTSPLYTS